MIHVCAICWGPAPETHCAKHGWPEFGAMNREVLVELFDNKFNFTALIPLHMLRHDGTNTHEIMRKFKWKRLQK